MRLVCNERFIMMLDFPLHSLHVLNHVTTFKAVLASYECLKAFYADYLEHM